MNLDSDRIDRITANATARAKIVQVQIKKLRMILGLPGSSPKDTAHIALLASYDAEMAYLMKIPGVAQALFDEGAP